MWPVSQFTFQAWQPDEHANDVDDYGDDHVDGDSDCDNEDGDQENYGEEGDTDDDDDDDDE